MKYINIERYAENCFFKMHSLREEGKIKNEELDMIFKILKNSLFLSRTLEEHENASKMFFFDYWWTLKKEKLNDKTRHSINDEQKGLHVSPN